MSNITRIHIFIVLSIFALTACTTGAERPDGEDVEMKPVGPPPAPKPAAEQPVTAEPEPAEEERVLSVEIFQLTPQKSHESTAGLEFDLESLPGPKKKEDVKLTVSKNEETKTVLFPADTRYGEAEAFGEVFSVRVSEEALDVTLRLEANSEPLSESEAREIAAREAARRMGCAGEASNARTTPANLFVYRIGEGEDACAVVVGLYTREIVDP